MINFKTMSISISLAISRALAFFPRDQFLFKAVCSLHLTYRVSYSTKGFLFNVFCVLVFYVFGPPFVVPWLFSRDQIFSLPYVASILRAVASYSTTKFQVSNNGLDWIPINLPNRCGCSVIYHVQCNFCRFFNKRLLLSTHKQNTRLWTIYI